MSDEQKLAEIRQSIDALDEEIQSLVSQRAALAIKVARAKGPQDDAGAYYRPEREADVLRRAIERNDGPLSDAQITALFREIMSSCLALQQQLTIAFLGPEGTFTQAAVRKQFGHSVRDLALDCIEDVFREVEAGAAQFGIVPVENSSQGVITHTLDSFVGSPLSICGEVELRIHQHLLGRQTDLSRVRRVYGHDQSLRQCSHWLDSKLPAAERVSVSSNAEGARRAAGESDAVAIAGELAAELYDLQSLAQNIEDHPDNTTRFLIIGRQSIPVSGDDKTSLLFSTANESGALQKSLAVLADAGISMTRIESRPSRQGLWEYIFFVDILGHAEEPAVAQALARLQDEVAMLKVLGSYPRAIV